MTNHKSTSKRKDQRQKIMLQSQQEQSQQKRSLPLQSLYRMLILKTIFVCCILFQAARPNPSSVDVMRSLGVWALTSTTATLSIRGHVISTAGRQKWHSSDSDMMARRRSRKKGQSSYLVLRSSSDNVEDSSSGTIDDETSFPQISSKNTQKIVEVSEIDVRYGYRSSLAYDSSSGRYIPKPEDHSLKSQTSVKEKKLELQNMPSWRRKIRQSPPLKFYRRHIYPILHSSFLPEGVSPSYYRFMRWRIAQRFFNANVHVFGTQSLLLGLGVKSKSAAASSATAALGLSAALTWVLKDALGKIVRMIWASRMGRKFDPDAKRWRFRSSLVFAMGNGLEVTSYIYPQLFLLWATLANCCKQVSMLTSSATRNALYNSFKVGNRENIGDITAKGEAQIAVVDLLGIATGVQLSRAVGVSVKSVLTVWILLQAVEIFCMYHEIRSVMYRVLNYERLCSVVDSFLSSMGKEGSRATTFEAASTEDSVKTEEDCEFDDNISSSSNTNSKNIISTPKEIAHSERMFLPPSHLARRAIAFGSIGRARLNPDELDELASNIFRGEKFMLVVGEDLKNDKPWKRLIQLLSGNNDQEHKMLLTFFSNRWRRIREEATTTKPNGETTEEKVETNHARTVKRRKKLNAVVTTAVEKARRNCHIVLHADANNVDIVKSTLALKILRRKLASKTEQRWREWESKCFNEDKGFDETCLSPPLPSSALRSSDCFGELREVCHETNELFPKLLNTMTECGWAPPARFMFGRVSMRAEWPVQKGKVGGGREMHIERKKGSEGVLNTTTVSSLS